DGKALLQPPLDWGLSVMIRDLNQDGLPDIYVCNDFDSPERVWINKGTLTPALSHRMGEGGDFISPSPSSKGSPLSSVGAEGFAFRALPRLSLRKSSFFSMGVDVADINRDGFDDIFVLDMLSRDHRRRMNFAPA